MASLDGVPLPSSTSLILYQEAFYEEKTQTSLTQSFQQISFTQANFW